MGQIVVNPVAITANTQKNSSAQTLPADVSNVTVQLTDSTGATTPLAGSNWLTTVGNITRWGVQRNPSAWTITGITNTVNPTITVSVDISQSIHVGDLLSIDNVTFSNGTRGADQLQVLAVSGNTFQVQLATKPGNYVSGGVIYLWQVYQTALAFGSLDRHGGMPALGMSSSDLIANTNDLLRLSIITDTNITLGAVITTS